MSVGRMNDLPGLPRHTVGFTVRLEDVVLCYSGIWRISFGYTHLITRRDALWVTTSAEIARRDRRHRIYPVLQKKAG
jgi:hypothetical protein